jgi:hypothetical protein
MPRPRRPRTLELPIQRRHLAPLTLIALLGIATLAVLLALRSDNNPDQADQATSTTEDTTSEATGGAQSAEDELPYSPDDVLSPEGEVDGFHYEQVGTNWYPISINDGPEVFTDSRSTGFAQTPNGAALAAIHIFRRWNSVQNPDGWEITIDEQVRGDGKELLRERILRGSSTNESGWASTANTAVVGWNITAFNPLEAQIEWYSLTRIDGDQAFIKLPVRLVWGDSDWRLVIPDSGTYYGMAEQTNLVTDPPEVDLSEVFR